jgi:zinc/manganese transport system permease protein
LAAVGATLFALCRFRDGRVPQEAIIGLVYAIAAAMAILLIDSAPHGAEHFKEIMTGSILWVTWPAIAKAAGIYALVGLFHWVYRDRFLLISEDPEEAWARGWNVRWWDFLFYLSFGLVITVSVDVAGVLIVFVFLVAPAILGLMVARDLRTQLLLGWGLGVVVTTVGLLVAYVYDLSTGPTVIATYGATMLVFGAAASVVRTRERAAAWRRLAGVVLAFALAAAFLVGAGRWLGARYRHAGEIHAQDTSGPLLSPNPAAAAISSEDPGERSRQILHALHENSHEGASMALRFLREDPPLFFRRQVVDELIAIMGDDPGFAPEKGADSDTNRNAERKVREYFDL